MAQLEQQTEAKLSILPKSCSVQLMPPTLQDRHASIDSNIGEIIHLKPEEYNDKHKYRRSPQYGRKWTVEGGCVRADWSICLDLLQISTTLCKRSPLPDIASYAVTYFGEGVGHKVYKVSKVSKAHSPPVIMRLALPLGDNGKKTRSEQATHDFPCAAAKEICVPTIIASCTNASENGNDVQLDGAELGCQWYDSKDFEARKNVVKQIAKYHALLYRLRFNRIGSLFASNTADNPQVGPLLERQFLYSPYKVCEGGRGPYKNSYDWLSSRLESASERIDTVRQAFFEDKELYYAKIAEGCIPKLKEALSKIFNEDDEEETTLYHIDTHANNFVVNHQNQLSGMLDWEFAFCAPLWLACQPPRFLAECGLPISNPPDPNYFNMEDEEELADYQYNKEEWETGQLLICFVLTVAKAEPDWAQAFLDGGLKRSFESVTQSLHCRGGLQATKGWLQAWERGTIMGEIPELHWLQYAIPIEWQGDGLEQDMTVREALETLITRSTMVKDASQ